MPVNKYFNSYSLLKDNEQRLYEDLINEAIQIHGHEVYYLPRENWGEVDQVFGENVNSKFEKAYMLDVYIEDTKKFGGDQDFFSKFGLEIRDNANFVVSRLTFERYVPKSITTRPREGDLVWMPSMNRIFEVKFVEEEKYFFTKGNRTPYAYELRCELFRSSNETINTGIDELDSTDKDSSYAIEIAISGTGDFIIGEKVFQGESLANSTMSGTVSSWDSANNKLDLIDIVGTVRPDANLIGSSSNTSYSVSTVDTMGDYVYYDMFDNKLIQDEANTFVSFEEINPFGMPVYTPFVFLGYELIQLLSSVTVI